MKNVKIVLICFTALVLCYNSYAVGSSYAVAYETTTRHSLTQIRAQSGPVTIPAKVIIPPNTQCPPGMLANGIDKNGNFTCATF
jgi:hypothetical protein